MKAYLIREETGEREDYSCQVFCVFLDKEKAEKRLAECIASEQKFREENQKENRFYPESEYMILEMDISE